MPPKSQPKKASQLVKAPTPCRPTWSCSKMGGGEPNGTLQGDCATDGQANPLSKKTPASKTQGRLYVSSHA